MTRCIFWLVLMSAASSLPGADVGEVIPHRQDKPPNKPYSPTESLAKMTVPEGFSVELVAGEPDLVNPIAMAFDDRGRIWITESLEYPRKSAGPGRDCVKVLEDTNGDGRADKFTVFTDNLNIPTGVAIGYGGVWVLNAPDLLFMREQNGKEISREVVVTGFGRADTHELPNSLTWGPDGWLYGLNGVFNESRVRSNSGKEYSFTCALWRVNPRTRDFQVVCEGTSNPYGIAWDTEGSAIVEACHWANDHLFHFVETGYYQRQAGAYPPFTMRIGSITDHGHQKTAYCGISFFDSDVYPAQYRERIYVGNIHGGCINVDRLQRDGATYLAKAEPDFLTANDAWSMPVSLKVGPDGCLYVLDWYDRYHCYQDANRDPEGIDRLRGRLYRVRYKNTPRAPPFDLASETDDQLIARLGSPNIYFRESAQRLLTERNRAATRPKLEKLVMDGSASRKPRMHALWALVGTGALEADFHQRLLAHADPAYRAWGVRAAGNFKQLAPFIRGKVAALATDSSPDVQLQIAIAARKIEGLDALTMLVDVLAHCGEDKLIPSVVWPNLHPLLEEQSERLASLVRERRLAPAQVLLMPRLVERILSARQPDASAVATLIGLLARDNFERTKECLAVVSSRSGELSEQASAELRARLRPFLEAILAGNPDHPLRLSAQLLAARLKLVELDATAVRQQLVSASTSEALRLQALEALIAFKDPDIFDALQPVWSGSDARFLTKVLAALGRVDDPKLADALLAQYPKLAPALQPLAIDLLMQREPWARTLLNAVLEKKLPSSVLNANYLRKILESNDREAVWAVEKAFGQVREERNPEREKVVAEMGEFLRQHPGDAQAGQQVFQRFCEQCHTIYGAGGTVGPDITANGRASFEQLLSNVFDPSLVIGPAYQVTTVVTDNGRNLTGLVTEDNDQRVTIKMPGEGVETISRNHIKYTRVSKLSMMPEGVETLLDKKELADLFAFLALDKPPGDPQARLIPGAPTHQLAAANSDSQPASTRRLKIERDEKKFTVRARASGNENWFDLVTCVTDPARRPYLHPVRDPSGRLVLTDDRPADHPWQHGIFTGFHGMVNGHEYWMENDGQLRFARLLEVKEAETRASWRWLTELVEPGGRVILEQEDSITVHAPESPEFYVIDFDLLLRAKEQDVKFEQAAVGGLAARMPWVKANPRQTHLNSNGERGRQCDKQRAAWCNVERPFGGETFGIAILDHPDNPGHPSGWRVDEQGLINPAVNALGDWTIAAGKTRSFRYRIVVYQGSATAEMLEREFQRFAQQPRQSSP